MWLAPDFPEYWDIAPITVGVGGDICICRWVYAISIHVVQIWERVLSTQSIIITYCLLQPHNTRGTTSWSTSSLGTATICSPSHNETEFCNWFFLLRTFNYEFCLLWSSGSLSFFCYSISMEQCGQHGQSVTSMFVVHVRITCDSVSGLPLIAYFVMMCVYGGWLALDVYPCSYASIN